MKIRNFKLYGNEIFMNNPSLISTDCNQILAEDFLQRSWIYDHE